MNDPHTEKGFCRRCVECYPYCYHTTVGKFGLLLSNGICCGLYGLRANVIVFLPKLADFERYLYEAGRESSLWESHTQTD